jgi:hypothetical protein
MQHNDRLKEVVIKMLQENTGRHMLDSGGAYGRHWERNQKLSSEIEFWDKTPEMVPTGLKYGELWGTISLYHHLVNSLQWDDDIELLNEMYEYFDACYPDDSYFETRVKFVEFLQSYNFKKEIFMKINEAEDAEALEDWTKFLQTNWEKITEACNSWDFGHEFKVYNTYNEENSLSQDFEIIIFGDLVGIMIHNGCDARGGYTKPRFFSTPQMADSNLWSWDDYTLYCTGENSDHYWDKQGYNSWYTDSEFSIEKETVCKYEDLTEEAQIEFDTTGFAAEEPEVNFAYEGQTILEGFDVRLKKPAGKKILVIKDGKAYCPICGAELVFSKFGS